MQNLTAHYVLKRWLTNLQPNAHLLASLLFANLVKGQIISQLGSTNRGAFVLDALYQAADPNTKQQMETTLAKFVPQWQQIDIAGTKVLLSSLNKGKDKGKDKGTKGTKDGKDKGKEKAKKGKFGN